MKCPKCGSEHVQFVTSTETTGVSGLDSFCGIMFMDWFVQYLNIRPSTNPRRLITGILGGFGLLRLEFAALFWLGRYLVDMAS